MGGGGVGRRRGGRGGGGVNRVYFCVVSFLWFEKLDVVQQVHVDHHYRYRYIVFIRRSVGVCCDGG